MSPFMNFSFLYISAVISVFQLSYHVVSCQNQRDDTIKDHATGKDVVEAVLRKIAKSGIFPEDNTFLIRLAYVETRFGTEGHTFRSGYYGGIWQVDEMNFRKTKASSLAKLHLQIQSKFNIDWRNNVTWRSLTTPLHSGLAAALYFAGVNQAIPQTILAQAEYWQRYFRPSGSTSKFIRDAKDLPNQSRCHGKMDFCIVLDSSGSIGDSDYQIAKDFIAKVIESFTLDFTRIGMLVYSSGTRDIFELRDGLSIPQMATRAKNAVYLKSQTRTDLGIIRGIEMFRNVKSIEGTPKVMMVLTDGQSSPGDLPGAVRSVRQNGVKTLSVGIGNGINKAELLFIALNDSLSVFQLSDFTSLQDFLFQLTSVTCEVPQAPVVNGTYKDSLKENERRIYQMEVPNTGVTVFVNVTKGKTVGYWSFTEEVPNGAVHDGAMGETTYIPGPGNGVSARIAKRDTSGGGGVKTHKTRIVYFSIEGVGPLNNYTISTMEGKLLEGEHNVGAGGTFSWDLTDDDEEDLTTTEVVMRYRPTSRATSRGGDDNELAAATEIGDSEHDLTTIKDGDDFPTTTEVGYIDLPTMRSPSRRTDSGTSSSTKVGVPFIALAVHASVILSFIV